MASLPSILVESPPRTRRIDNSPQPPTSALAAQQQEQPSSPRALPSSLSSLADCPSPLLLSPLDSPSSSTFQAPRMRQKSLPSPPPPPSSVPSSRSDPLLSGGEEERKEDDPAAAAPPPSAPAWEHLRYWLVHLAWPGLGLFGESYVLFSIGLLTPVWEIVYPDCWSSLSSSHYYHSYGGGDEEAVAAATCRRSVLQSITYSVVLGVIFGMLVIGYHARRLGRRRGSIATASFMFAGALGLAASSVLLRDPQLLFLFTSIMLFVFGVGVGGEYPLAACSASEAAMGEMKQELKQALDREEEQQLRRISGAIGPDGLSVIAEEGTSISKNSKAPSQHLQQHRGRQVQLVFTMQGMGIFVNSLSMTVLLLVMGQTTNQYNRESLLLLWRTLYLLGATMLLFVLLTRYRFLKESRVWLDDKRRRLQLARNLFISPAVEPGGALQTKVGNLAEAYAPPSTQIYTNRLSLSQAAASSPPPPATVAPEIPEVRTNRSGFSDISSLSAPSVELLGDDHGEGGICGVIKEVPSTDPQDDLRANDWSLLWRNYGARLLGTSLSWLLWDVAFYGNKLFQSSFLLALTGEETTLLELALAATVNSFVALLGYFSAAAILDHPNVGRCRLQAWGFLLTGCLFVGCGLLYKSLSPTVLVTMYLGSSFFGQLGPNATTFLIPAEIFPTEMRTVCHGISAASGKLGALMAAVAFHHLSDIDMFLVSGYASLAACAISFWWIPETSGLDLYETDRRWRLILDGRRGEYEGEANHIRFLSFYERYKLRVQRRRNDSRAHLDSHFDAGY